MLIKLYILAYQNYIIRLGLGRDSEEVGTEMNLSKALKCISLVVFKGLSMFISLRTSVATKFHQVIFRGNSIKKIITLKT